MSKRKKSGTRYAATSPITLVAKDCLDDRLESVWRFALLTAKEADRNVEHVHQLRVCVRRAAAAIDLFAPLLTRKKTRRIRKQLRTLRRAAGPARELDVLAQRLSAIDAESSEHHLKKLRQAVATHRCAAQPQIKRSYKEAKRKGFVKAAKKLVKDVKWRGKDIEPDFRTFAKMTFEPIANRFFAAGEGDQLSIEALHRIRIEGKTVRYAMELLSPAFEGSFREDIFPAFAEVQDKLGKINDHASAIGFYRRLLTSTDKKKETNEIKKMIGVESKELESSRIAFLGWWTPPRSYQMRQRFAAILGTPRDEDGAATN